MSATDNQAGAVRNRVHGKSGLGAKPKAEAVAEILAVTRHRKT